MKKLFKANKGIITLGITALTLAVISLGGLAFTDFTVNANDSAPKVDQVISKGKSTEKVEREAAEYIEKQRHEYTQEQMKKKEAEQKAAEIKKIEAEKEAKAKAEREQAEAQRIAQEEEARKQAEAQVQAEQQAEVQAEKQAEEQAEEQVQAEQETSSAPAQQSSSEKQASAPAQQSIGANMIGINGIYKSYYQLGGTVDTPTIQNIIDQGHIVSALTYFNPGDGQTTYFGGHNPGVMAFMEANMQFGAIVTITDGNGTAYNYKATDHVIVDTVGSSVFSSIGLSAIDVYSYGSGQESIAIQYCQTYGGLMNMWYLTPA